MELLYYRDPNRKEPPQAEALVGLAQAEPGDPVNRHAVMILATQAGAADPVNRRAKKLNLSFGIALREWGHHSRRCILTRTRSDDLCYWLHYSKPSGYNCYLITRAEVAELVDAHV